MGPWSHILIAACWGRSRWRILCKLHFFPLHKVGQMIIVLSLRFLVGYGNIFHPRDWILCSILYNDLRCLLIGRVRSWSSTGHLITSILYNMCSILLFLCCSPCKNQTQVNIGHCLYRNDKNRAHIDTGYTWYNSCLVLDRIYNLNYLWLWLLFERVVVGNSCIY